MDAKNAKTGYSSQEVGIEIVLIIIEGPPCCIEWPVITGMYPTCLWLDSERYGDSLG